MVKKIKKLKHKFTVIIILILSCYFFFLALLGDKGLYKLARTHEEMQMYSMQLSQLKSYQKNIEQKIKGLNSENPDLDLLDEQVRNTLGYADRDEKIIYK